MSESVDVAGTEDEATPKLKWILAQPMLAMPAGLCSFSSDGVVFAQQVEQGSLVQFSSAISFALFVYQQGERDPGVFPEVAGIGKVAETDRYKFGAFVGQRLLVFAQLRDVLAAEDSAVMAQEHNHGRRVGPKRTKTDRLVVRVGQS